MMRNQKGYTTLIIMVIVAVAALLLGFLVMRQRIQTPSLPETNTQANPDDGQNQDQTQASEQTTPAQTSANITDWKTYVNEKHGFQVQYPPGLKAGIVSGNSVLGTFQVPIKGFHVGPLVFVVLKDSKLKQEAVDYFNGFYDEALHPSPATPGEPSVSCKTDKISNSNVVNIRSVSCTGEGGAARYAYISGKNYDVFVDGYSKGYDNQDNGDFTKDTEYPTMLGTFKFSTATATIPGIQTFTIAADDSSATPAEISVPAGTIVEITFNVSSSNVYYGGLDFRSSVVNSGTVGAGESKTISFTAKQSFSFTPYWPASGVAKSYTIRVNVQ